MTWLNCSFSKSLLVAMSFICGAGCGQLWSAFAGSRDPHASGTWTGRLVSVTVVDNEGQGHEAAALQIETGPKTLGRGVGEPYTLREHDVPYLAPVGVVIVEPTKLGIVPGTRVRVRGDLIMHSAGVDVVDIPGKPKVFRGVRRVPGEPPGDVLVIQMRGKPKVVRD